MAPTQLAIGVDLGATKIAAVLANRQGQIIAEERRPTQPEQGVAQVVANLVAGITTLIQAAREPIAGIGIGTPGQVDPVTGIVRNAVNLGWQKVELVAQIQPHLPRSLPIYIQKDANAEVLGEAYFGAGQGAQNLVYLGLGSGLGGGALVNGQIVIGQNFTASEIGHLSLDPNGRACSCGLRGCAETVVSGPGLLAVTRAYLHRQLYPTQLSDSPQLTPQAVIAAAQAGDPLGQAVLAQVASWLGIVASAYVAILNPARIIIGGGVGRAAFELLLPGVQAELARRVLAPSLATLQIVPSQLSSSALGAASLVWQQEVFQRR